MAAAVWVGPGHGGVFPAPSVSASVERPHEGRDALIVVCFRMYDEHGLCRIGLDEKCFQN